MQAELYRLVAPSPGAADPSGLGARELRELAVLADSSKVTQRDPAEAALAWRALVDGRSDVVDQFDANGRRYFVVRRRDGDCSKLTSRERQVLNYAALGYAGKRIAYENRDLTVHGGPSSQVRRNQARLSLARLSRLGARGSTRSNLESLSG